LACFVVAADEAGVDQILSEANTATTTSAVVPTMASVVLMVSPPG
jgi:hypothetical protein